MYHFTLPTYCKVSAVPVPVPCMPDTVGNLITRLAELHDKVEGKGMRHYNGAPAHKMASHMHGEEDTQHIVWARFGTVPVPLPTRQGGGRIVAPSPPHEILF